MQAIRIGEAIAGHIMYVARQIFTDDLVILKQFIGYLQLFFQGMLNTEQKCTFKFLLKRVKTC